MLTKLFSIFALAFLTACAPLPVKPGFDSVKTLLRPRLTQEISWRQTEQERRDQQAAVMAQLNAPLTLDAALGIGLINNPRLQASYEKLGMSYGDWVQAGLPANPSLGLSWRSSAVGVEHGFTIVQDLLSLLTLAPRKRMAATAFEQTKYGTAQQVLELAMEVKKAYFSLAAESQILDFVRGTTDAANVAAELAERQHQAGNINKRELALQQEFAARSALAMARQELALAESRERLSALLGLTSAQRDWTLASINVEPNDLNYDLAGLESQAAAERFDVAAARKNVDLVADSLGVASQYRYLSALGLGFSYERATDGERLRGPSLELGLPLWDRGQGKRMRMEAELRESQAKLEALSLDVAGDVRGAHARLTNAQRSAQHFRDTLLPLHERIVAETQKFYNGMLLGVYDLLLARQNQLNARRDYVETIKSYWLARADLEHAVGGGNLGAAMTKPVTQLEPPPAPVSDMPATHKHH